MNIYPEVGPTINGQTLNSSNRKVIPIENPANFEVLGELTLATEPDLDAALESASKGFEIWRRTSPVERSRILRRIADILRERAEDVANVMTLEQGKVLAESFAEVEGTAEHFEWCAEEGRRTYGRAIPSRAEGQSFLVTHEPIGPVAGFSPWNFPLLLPGRKISIALAAGCSIIIKPAEETPACGYLLADICLEAGVPPQVISVVFGNPPDVSSKLITSPVVRKASITGSVQAGRAIGALCGERLKRCTLELGGHAPMGVFPDVDIDRTVAQLVMRKYRNAGQVCVSPSRFFVHKNVFDEFTEKFVALAESIKVGDGMDPASQMGPLANERQLTSVEKGITDAVDRGAGIATGGNRIGSIGYMHEPTVLIDVPDDASLMQNEPFGPVAPIVKFSDTDEFIDRANSIQFGLAGSVFSNDLKICRHVAERLEVGMLGINETAYGLPETPVCGVKSSGFGHEGGVEGLGDHLVTKFVVENVQP